MTSPNSSTSNTIIFNPQVNWVPIFKGENFEQWSMQMKSIFITQDIWEIVQEGYRKPKNTNEEATWSETKKGLYKQNLRRDNFALSIIYSGVDETILPTIMDAATAREAWSILEIKYKGSQKVENNSQQITHEKVDEIAISLKSMMESQSMIYSNMSKCCIYTVPEYIRKGYEQCYRPLSTSIGPVFYKDPKLEAMQELKRIYLIGFSEHPGNSSQSFHPYIKFVSENETKIRECYQQEINLSSDEFIQMIVLDAAFLIYLILSISEGRSPHKKIDDKFRVPYTGLVQDLFLVENQLPFSVLMRIYDIAFGADYPSFIKRTLKFIKYACRDFPACKAIDNIMDDKKKIDLLSKVTHLLDFRRQCCLHTSGRHMSKGKVYIICKNIINVSKCRMGLQKMCCCLPFCRWQETPKPEQEEWKETKAGPDQLLKFTSARHLRAAGVKFELSKSNDPFNITFNNGVLRIPGLTVHDGTESTLRNLMFFEQCRGMTNSKVTDYICFIDRLVDTEEDIQVLQKKGILTHHLGCDEDAANLFNKLNRYIVLDPSNFSFSDVSEDLKNYSSRRRNKWKGILYSRYCNHPWAIISVIAAVILLILTVLQTITGFLQLS